MSKIPFVAFGADELAVKPEVPSDKMIDCPHCHKRHKLEFGKNTKGEPVETLMFYKCGDKAYLGAVAGKLV